MEQNDDKNIRYVRGACGEYCNGKFYIYSVDFNGILEYDLGSDRKRILSGRKNENDNAVVLSDNSVLYKDAIYFMPRYANSILKFPVDTQEQKEILVSSRKCSFAPVVVNDRMLLMPCCYTDKFPSIDLKTNTVQYIPFYMPEYLEKMIDSRTSINFLGNIVRKNFIYSACRFSPYISKFNFKDNTFEYIKIKEIDEKLRDVAYDGNAFWIILAEGRQIIKWDEEKNKVLKCIDLRQYVTDAVEAFALKFVRGMLYILIKSSPKIIELNDVNDSVHVYDPEQIPGFRWDGDVIFSRNICTDEKDSLYFIPRNANGILRIDKERKMQLFTTDIPTRNIMETFSCLQLNERMCSADDFLKMVTKRELYDSFYNRLIGAQIWDCIYRRELQ